MIAPRARRVALVIVGAALTPPTTTFLAACGSEAPAASASSLHRAATLAPERAVAAHRVHHESVAVSRHDLLLDADGIDGAVRRANLSPALLDQLDEAFVGRVDLFAQAARATRISIWLRDADATLVAAKLDVARGPPLFAAWYDGDLAPRGFYDAAGMSMDGALRARPVSLRRITSRFGARFDAFTGTPSTHHGVDYGVPRGTPVMSVAPGRVAAIGHSERAGNFIKLTHPAGYESLYLHLDSVDAALRVGSVVARGQRIAASGNTGRSTGPHLHYELHLAGIPVDPLAMLPMPEVALGPHGEARTPRLHEATGGSP